MAEPQPADTQQPASDIAALTGAGDKGTVADLVKVDRAKVAEDTAITRAADKRMEHDQARLDQAFAAEGHSAAESLHPWNPEEQHKRFETNPIEGLGSVGSLFAVIASAFTRAPMQNAIEGVASAIQAQQDGNEIAYERAHQSWKDNTRLALDRFRMQHDLYQDAMSLMDHNVAAADAKLRNAATRFGDQQMMTLAEHGMVKEMFELQAARARAADQILSYSDKLAEHDFKKAAITAMQRGFQSTGDPNQDKIILAKQALKILNDKDIGTAEHEAIGNYVLTHNPADPNFAAGLADLHQKFMAKAPNVAGYQEARNRYIDLHGDIPPDVDAKLLAEFGLSGRLAAAFGGGGAGGTLTNERVINHDAEEHKARMRQEHPDWDEAKLDADRDAYVRQRRSASSAPSGNKIDELQGKIDQAERVIEGSQKNLDFLRSYKGGAGLLGKIMRGEEIATNIAGISTQSERVEFRRRVHELQEMAPRILVDANGRPLKAEQEKVSGIVAGLQAGDTGPNTIRAYEELIRDMEVRIQKYRERQGKAAPTAAPAAPAGSTDWLSAYPEKR